MSEALVSSLGGLAVLIFSLECAAQDEQRWLRAAYGPPINSGRDVSKQSTDFVKSRFGCFTADYAHVYQARKMHVAPGSLSPKGVTLTFSGRCLPPPIRAPRATLQPESDPSAQTHSSKPRTNPVVSSRPPLNVTDLQVLRQ